ncbi:uncharacterized protein si:dkey-9i23.16 [Solea solea]|uniref:uncharacterized protein si:dkey-9i23.16 n=1 Tax=Solea solea TaxID=90069 RepID=UPI00272B8E36|nr:uncharacterized protein si:dkey-9i23.16 [Solea solea]
MQSVGVAPAIGPKLNRFATWFDPESAAVVSILLGLFQVLLSAPLAYAGQTLPKFYILPFVLGVIIVAGGSLTMANERYPSRYLLQGCACSNALGLLGALLAFVLYCYSLNKVHTEDCIPVPNDRPSRFKCPEEVLAAYTSSVTLLLVLYDTCAVVLQCLLTVSAFKALKTD